eukprot:244635_1
MITHHCKEQKFQSIETYPYATSFQTTKSSKSISLLSWNITHKDFINEYGMCPTSNELDWNHRLPKIKAKLSQSNADIICLQEIDKKSFAKDIGSTFEQNHGYTVKANYHPNHKPKNGKGGVIFSTAIMFKSSKFECMYENHRGRTMILLLTNTLEKQKCTKCSCSKHPCLYHSVFVACVHLESPRKGKKNEKTRMSQIKAVLNKGIRNAVIDILNLDRNDSNAFTAQIPDLRVLIVGDFNSGHGCGTSQMVLTPANSYFPHSYQFKDAYHENVIASDYNTHGLPATNCNLRIKYFPSYAALGNIFSIDLLFYTANNIKLKANTHTLPQKVKDKLNWNELLGERIEEWIKNYKRTNKNGQWNLCDFDNILFLPNEDIPSDHLPLGAVFEFDDVCDAQNEDKKECRCCLEHVVKKKTKKKNKKSNKNTNAEWKVHEMNSF